MIPRCPFLRVRRRSQVFRIGLPEDQIRKLRRRRALLMTETELRLIAAPAMIGLSSRPKNG
jgi:hypothetical protein